MAKNLLQSHFLGKSLPLRNFWKQNGLVGLYLNKSILPMKLGHLASLYDFDWYTVNE